jgi:hypothetical protein
MCKHFIVTKLVTEIVCATVFRNYFGAWPFEARWPPGYPFQATPCCSYSSGVAFHFYPLPACARVSLLAKVSYVYGNK